MAKLVGGFYHTPNVCGFDSQSGHITRSQVWSPVGGTFRRQLSHVSLSHLSLSLYLSQTNKHSFWRRLKQKHYPWVISVVSNFYICLEWMLLQKECSLSLNHFLSLGKIQNGILFIAAQRGKANSACLCLKTFHFSIKQQLHFFRNVTIFIFTGYKDNIHPLLNFQIVQK